MRVDSVAENIDIVETALIKGNPREARPVSVKWPMHVVLCASVARLTLGAERGRAAGMAFWDARPFSRILEWGKDYRQACLYVARNTLQALGFVPAQDQLRTSGPNGAGRGGGTETDAPEG